MTLQDAETGSRCPHTTKVIEIIQSGFSKKKQLLAGSGADPGFFLGGGALVSCSTSTPINHIVFFWENTSCIRKPQVISGGRGGGVRTPCTLPLDPPLWILYATRNQPTQGLVYGTSCLGELLLTALPK